MKIKIWDALCQKESDAKEVETPVDRVHDAVEAFMAERCWTMAEYPPEMEIHVRIGEALVEFLGEVRSEPVYTARLKQKP